MQPTASCSRLRRCETPKRASDKLQYEHSHAVRVSWALRMRYNNLSHPHAGRIGSGYPDCWSNHFLCELKREVGINSVQLTPDCSVIWWASPPAARCRVIHQQVCMDTWRGVRVKEGCRIASWVRGAMMERVWRDWTTLQSSTGAFRWNVDSTISRHWDSGWSLSREDIVSVRIRTLRDASLLGGSDCREFLSWRRTMISGGREGL